MMTKIIQTQFSPAAAKFHRMAKTMKNDSKENTGKASGVTYYTMKSGGSGG